MRDTAPWVDDNNVALLTDLYELTMLQAYWREQMLAPATFSLFVRTLPEQRNWLLACGLDDVLRFLERLHFSAEALAALGEIGPFEADFLDWLAAFRFTGDVRAVPEGTPVFADEPILEITAPLPEAQLVETFVMNQIHVQTLLATKAARVVEAAGNRAVVDFGLRRIHGTDAGLKAARAFHIAGVEATSNVLAGAIYGVPVTGTMAHSYIQAHDDEDTAFRAFASIYPDSVLLVDTYDTLDAVRRIAALAVEAGDTFRVRAIRLDSGDLGKLAKESRRILDHAGLRHIEIFASGGLDEFVVRDLLADGAPIDGFGVGTGMGTSRDVPALDIAYKLTEYAGHGRLKLSPGKPVLPGRKQVFRSEADGRAVGDVIARADESLAGRALLVDVMRNGERTPASRVSLDETRSHAQREIAALPPHVRALDHADPRYPVSVSEALRDYQQTVTARVTD